MKVLFVYSGNHESNFDLTENQGKTLENEGLIVEYFIVFGKGVWGYLKQIIPLNRRINQGHFDIVHAHYSFCGIISGLVSRKPVVVSLMGSDIYESLFWRLVIKIFTYFFWETTIVKSLEMKEYIKIKKVKIIPNGVNIDFFKPMSKNDALDKLNWNKNEIHILFGASPDRPEKNFQLAQTAISNLKRIDVKLHFLENVPYEQMPFYINASDVLLLTSLWEGSPNVVKEAMACDCAIVSTDVGDVRELFGSTEGCYICSFDPIDVSEKIKDALEFIQNQVGKNSRQRIIEMKIDNESIAQRLIDVYEKVLKK